MTTDTPRTDAIEFRHCPPQPEAILKKHEDAYVLCCELERELAASKAEVDRLREQLQQPVDIADEFRNDVRLLAGYAVSADAVDELDQIKESYNHRH